MARTESDNQALVKRLNVMIALLLDQAAAGGKTVPMATKIMRLAELGLSSGDIADIVGKAPNYVTATLSQRKTTKKGK